MLTLAAGADGSIQADYPLLPGAHYSLYLVGHPGNADYGSPTAGEITVSQFNTDTENEYLPVLDGSGQAVTATLPDSQGIAVNFIAHCNRFQLSVSGFTEGDGLKVSLLNIR